ncbi:MAG: type I-C CRISPR-associated protein Cas7/Csd2 [Magnetococcales bacterium]|nr:type I-C CRISPR-associated protein Cas7/Csd2 [Magnetococcales bacterium]
MSILNHKIDFALIFRVKNANPNGDPLNGNRPRTTYANFGEVSDVAIKRKLRDRLLENGQNIFVQSDDRRNDDARSLHERAEKALGNRLGSSETAKLACERWFDVRAFGQLFALKGGGKGKGKKGTETSNDGDTGISVGIRGPVTVQSAISIEPVDVTSMQITKSVSGEGDGSKRGSDTMGMKHRVEQGVYVFYGSMNPQLAERTGFSDEDAEVIKKILPHLFDNDESSARPAGSMEVVTLFWWQHNCKAGQYSAAKVHRTLHVNPDGTHTLSHLEGLKPEMIPGH